MKRIVTIFSFFVLITGCKKSTNNPVIDPPVMPPIIQNTNLVKGADISWLTQMEADGIHFYDSAGAQKDCIQILKGLGFNAIRLRVWVNPLDGWCNTSDVVNKAKRAGSLGFKIMIDFHYSDVWADPGHQAKPLAWSTEDFSVLKTSLAQHTTTVIDSLKANGITPAWVQIGNETNDGMLWEDGRASANMSNFAQLVDAGYDAVKAIDTSIKVIVHISNGFDNMLFRWMFDGLKANGARWDIIGMSLYPSESNWADYNTQCLSNMNDMVARYNKDVMIVEVGMSWDQPQACGSFLADIIAKTKTVTGGRGLGVFYWEPECIASWNNYTLGAFDNSGKPTSALNAFK